MLMIARSNVKGNKEILCLSGHHDASLRGWQLGVQQPEPVVMLQAIWQQTIQKRTFALACTQHSKHG